MPERRARQPASLSFRERHVPSILRSSRGAVAERTQPTNGVSNAYHQCEVDRRGVAVKPEERGPPVSEHWHGPHSSAWRRSHDGRCRRRRAATEPHRGSDGSEPVVRNASSIPWQVFERAETVEMVNWDLRHSFGFGQAQIHCDAPPPLLVCLKRSPIRHAAALGTEVKLNRLATNVSLGRTRNVDAFAFMVIGPQHPVSTTHGAVARRGRLRDSAESPAHCAAVAGALDRRRHRQVSAELRVIRAARAVLACSGRLT